MVDVVSVAVVVIRVVLVVDGLSLEVGTVVGVVLVVDGLSLEVGTVVVVVVVTLCHLEVDVELVIVGQSGQIGRPVG